jgi:hypothetical protein
MARTSQSYISKKFDVGDRHYLLYKQEPSAASPEGTTFGVFLLPPAEYALPLVERLQSRVDTEEDMWRWAQEAALSHAPFPNRLPLPVRSHLTYRDDAGIHFIFLRLNGLCDFGAPAPTRLHLRYLRIAR